MSESTPTHWRRAIRPLVWWSIMVLLMFAWRTHERLSAITHINFTPTLTDNQTGYESTATIDGLPASSGQRISIGWHTLSINHPKAKPYSTNLFVWYGENELGQISLERAMGTLVVSANPSALRLTIRGPEFSVTLTNSTGMTSSVPTDKYMIEGNYTHWYRRDEVMVSVNQTTVHSYAPKLGSLHIEASHRDMTYRLIKDDRNVVEAGTLPVTVSELPEGNYQLTSIRKGETREMIATVKEGMTNELKVEFVYGAVSLETDPPGASVIVDGNNLGITPLRLTEIKPGAWELDLRLKDFEPVSVSLVIEANQTNRFSTNLVSQFYTRAVELAWVQIAGKNFDHALESATLALKYKPNDDEAKRVQRIATGSSHLEKAKVLCNRGEFADAIKQLNIAKEFISENPDVAALLSDYSKREEDRIAAENKRQAELAEAERIKKEVELAEQQARQKISQLNQTFSNLSRGYENAAGFNSHELTTSNAVGAVATAINNALSGRQPVFQIINYRWPQSDEFTIQARQRVGLGYRECLIVGGQIRTNETKIVFKVFEYDHPPDLNIFGGLLNVSTAITTNPQDPKVAKEKAERFQLRIKEGVELIRGRMQVIGR